MDDRRCHQDSGTSVFITIELPLRSSSALPFCRRIHETDLRVPFQRAFPYDKNTPSGFRQLMYRPRIPALVGLQFRLPELRSGGRQPEQRTAFVTMPETSMHKNGSVPTSQHDIRTSWQVPCVQTKTKPFRPEGTPNQQLRRRVPASNPRHRYGTLLSTQSVCHRESPDPSHKTARVSMARESVRHTDDQPTLSNTPSPTPSHAYGSAEHPAPQQLQTVREVHLSCPCK